jgi:hypothetical protein
MFELITKLNQKYPELKFTPGKQFSWSPESREIIYKTGARGQKAAWSLLHETGHALLGHSGWQADYELIRLEMAAWQKARAIAGELDIRIDEDHIQDCLDTYRDWLYRRSLCPACNNKCLQESDLAHYRCFNCHTVWKVSQNRFARTYRSKKLIGV